MPFTAVSRIYNNLGDYISFSPSSFIKKLVFKESPEETNPSEEEIVDREEQDEATDGSWEEVDRDMMDMILKHQPLSTRIRMSLVCKSWRSMIAQNDNPNAPLVPWLALPVTPTIEELRFLDLLEGKFYALSLPKIFQGWWCCGSSKGWMVMLKRFPPFCSRIVSLVKEPTPKAEISLFNPMTKALILLPSLSTIPYYCTCTQKYNVIRLINKIEISSTDFSECTISAILFDDTMLAFCKPGDKQWTIFQGNQHENNRTIYCDILFCKGMFYTLVYNNPDPIESCTYTFGIGDNGEVSLRLVPDLTGKEYDEWPYSEALFLDDGTRMINHMKSFLVAKTNGELLAICRHQSAYRRLSGEVFEIEFDVFKFNPNNGQLDKVQGLGDQVICFMEDGSLSLSKKNLIGVHDNLIYFADVNHYLMSLEVGQFDISGRRRYLQYLKVSDVSFSSRLSWFTPVPW